MGVVYMARQVVFNRLVALKMIGSRLVRPEWRSRFQDEAVALARLDHPNIVRVIDMGEHLGLPYFTMEFVSGGNLDQKVNGTPLPPEKAADFVRVLAQAMQAAHEAGVVHRDLKPGNILLAPVAAPKASAGPEEGIELGTPKITDFGLARFLDDDSHQTRDGVVMGTPSYMAPEQADGRVALIGPRTDVYALGAILYELITGRPPFKGETVQATLDEVRRDDPVPPRRLRRTCPRDLETICLKCLEKHPHRRYPTAAGLADDLGRFLRGEPTLARPAGRLERLVKWGRRRPSQAALVGVLLLAALGAVVAVLYHIHQLEVERAEARRQQHLAEQQQQLAVKKATGQELLRRAQAYASRPDGLQSVVDSCQLVLQSIEESEAAQDTELLGLRQEAAEVTAKARKQLAEHERREKEQAERDSATKALLTFRNRRHDAFFLAHRNLIAEVEAPLEDVRQKALEALDPFGGPGAKGLGNSLQRYRGREEMELRNGLCEVLLVLADATARAGRREEALHLLDEAEKLGSASQTIQRRRAQYGTAGGAPATDKGPPRAAAGQAPSTGLDWFLSGRDRLLVDHDPAGAARDFTQALEQEPGMFWAHFLRAQSWLRQGNLFAAEMDLKACQKLREDVVWSYLLRGHVFMKAKEWASADSELAEADGLLVKHPDPAAKYVLHVNRGVLAMSRVNRGVLAMSCDNAAAAIPELRAAIDLDASRYHAYLNLSVAYDKTGDREQALECLSRGIEHDRHQARMYRARGELLHAAGKNDAALADFDEAIRCRPADAPAEDRAADHVELGRTLFDMGRYPQALAAAEEARELHSSDPQVHRLRGLTLFKLKRYAEALKALDCCQPSGNQVDGEILEARVQARIELGQLDALVDEYSRALARQPRADLYTRRGWARVVNGELRQAREDFEAALHILEKLAQQTRGTKQTQKEFEAAMRIRDNYADARIGLGVVKAMRDDYRSAIDDTEAALALEEEKHPFSRRLLIKAAGAFAQSVAALDRVTGPDGRLERGYLRGRCVQRALGLLDLSLRRANSAELTSFWEANVLNNNMLAPLFREPGFHDLFPRPGR
jgi:tetratricopeptide (TPR) repeat protein